jgi:hypothetical protein
MPGTTILVPIVTETARCRLYGCSGSVKERDLNKREESWNLQNLNAALAVFA